MITVTLKELVRIADEDGLPMLSYMLGMALIEARAQGGGDESLPDNVVPFVKN